MDPTGNSVSEPAERQWWAFPRESVDDERMRSRDSNCNRLGVRQGMQPQKTRQQSIYLVVVLRSPSGLQRCKNRLAFPGQMSYTSTKPGSLSHILAFFILCCCLLGPFLCIVTFRWYVFCLLVVLVELSVLAKWLARKIPLRKPNCGEGIVSTKPRLKSVYDCLVLLYSFVV